MPEDGTVLAFDLGLKRTGVAAGELGIGVAHPLTVIRTESPDERYTSQLAEEGLHEAGIHGKKNRDHLDAVAAQLILQGFLDARHTA